MNYDPPYYIEIDYGHGMIPLMDFDPKDPPEGLKFLSVLIQLCPSGISLEINKKGMTH